MTDWKSIITSKTCHRLHGHEIRHRSGNPFILEMDDQRLICKAPIPLPYYSNGVSYTLKSISLSKAEQPDKVELLKQLQPFGFTIVPSHIET
jgi:hypothetical protein